MKTDLPITDLFTGGKPLRSVEFFPPKDDDGWKQFSRTAERIASIKPDFVSITYGAGGSTRDRTDQAARILREEMGFLVMPHLTCAGSGQAEVLEVAKHFHECGFRNIMSLRGDPPKGETSFQPRDGLRYGSDLIRLLRSSMPDLCLGAGGYPEKHPEAPDMETDIRNLLEKVEAGADFITTQLFFDNAYYFRFVERCRAAGIDIPILPGIMPVLSYKQIQRFTDMCGASLPESLKSKLAAVQDSPDDVQKVGVQWAADQIEELLKAGAPGYHLYILNRANATLALVEALGGKTE